MCRKASTTASKITANEEHTYAALAEWAESDEAATAFAQADDMPDEDPTFLAVQAAARRELGRPRLDGKAPGTAGGRAPLRQVRLPRQLDDQLAEYTSAHATTRSEVMRDALAAFLSAPA